MNVKPVCERCLENHEKVFSEFQNMWNNLIENASNPKDKRYYQNCKQICENICGFNGTCTYYKNS